MEEPWQLFIEEKMNGGYFIYNSSSFDQFKVGKLVE
jgi:hypothetical protein